MSIEGTFRIRKTLPTPDGSGSFIAENIFRFQPMENGRLAGTVDTGQGDLIPFESGYHNGEFFKIIYTVGPGAWELCGRICQRTVTGVVSVAGGGSPDLAEGERIEE